MTIFSSTGTCFKKTLNNHTGRADFQYSSSSTRISLQYVNMGILLQTTKETTTTTKKSYRHTLKAQVKSKNELVWCHFAQNQAKTKFVWSFESLKHNRARKFFFLALFALAFDVEIFSTSFLLFSPRSDVHEWKQKHVIVILIERVIDAVYLNTIKIALEQAV